MAKFEPLLERYVVKDNRSALAFQKLSEGEKAEMSKDLVDSVFRATTERSMKLDYDDIQKSKGNLTKITNYTTLVSSLQLLRSMQTGMNERIEDLDSVENAHQNILNNTLNFEQGFRINNLAIMMLYNNLTMAVVASTSFLIATTVDYIKDPIGNYSAHYRDNIAVQKGYPTFMIDSLKKFNQLHLNGDLAKFFEYSFSKKAMAGITIAALGTATATLLAIGIAISIVPLMRELVYQYYHMRVSISDYLRLQASFLEMNHSHIGIIKNAKGTTRKQEKIMKTFIKLADKIDVDQKSSTKKAEIEIKRENNSISMESPAIASDNSYDNLL